MDGSAQEQALSAGTVMKFYDGFPTVGSAVTYGRVMEGAEEEHSGKGIDPRSKVNLCGISLQEVSVLTFSRREAHIFLVFKRWVGLFQAQAAIRKRPGCFLLEGPRRHSRVPC